MTFSFFCVWRVCIRAVSFLQCCPTAKRHRMPHRPVFPSLRLHQPPITTASSAEILQAIFRLKATLIHLPNHSLPYITKSTNSLFSFKRAITSPCFCLATCLPVRFFCKDNANECNESLLSNCRVQLVFCKESTFAASRQPHTVQILQRIGQ